MNKNVIRKNGLLKRQNIHNKKELSTVIVDKLLNIDIYKKAKVVALYYSLPMEVNTIDLINKALIDKIVLLPKVVNENIKFIKINSNTKYLKSNFNVLEPIGEEYLGNIDLIIVPGVVFDKNKNRLGYGKGYYDKYLCSKDIYKIGICFSEQIIDNIPNEKHDIKVDMIITEKEKI